MNQVTDKIIAKIKTEHITPMPKWKFWLRDGGLWTGLALLVLLTILSFGLLWYFWSDEPWLHGGRFGFGLIFGRMPIIFLTLIGAGIFSTLFYFRHTGRGYKYSLIKTGLLLLFMLVFIGGLFNYWGVSRRLDTALGSSSLYQSREVFMKGIWQRPDEGLLAGQIIEILKDDNFLFRDLDGKIWTVDSSGAIWRHNLKPETGLEIKIIGQAEGDGFIAGDIRPWIGSNGCAMMNQGKGTCGINR